MIGMFSKWLENNLYVLFVWLLSKSLELLTHVLSSSSASTARPTAFALVLPVDVNRDEFHLRRVQIAQVRQQQVSQNEKHLNDGEDDSLVHVHGRAREALNKLGHNEMQVLHQDW